MEINNTPSKELISNKRLAKALNELEEVLAPYLAQWNHWVITKHCFLSHKEITAIEFFRQYRRHNEAAEKLKLTPARVQKLYRRGLTKLKLKASAFHQSNGEKY